MNISSNSTSEIRCTQPDHIRALLQDHRQPVLLLGAGASIKSGVPDSAEIVNRAAKWAWCKMNGRVIDDPGVISSDWQPWLKRQPWFKKTTGLADQYPVAIDKLLGIADEKREFFENIISRGVRPSEGYRALARILDNGWIANVITTNFDHCLNRAVILENAPPFLVEIKTHDDWRRFVVSPSDPQLIYLHGSVEHYSDKNLEEEVAKLDPSIVDKLKPLLRDHPLVVVGYRGMEASVMVDLLLKQSDFTNRFQKGLFWCDLKVNFENPLSAMTIQLADAIGSNFNRVPIASFDQLMKIDLYDQLLAAKVAPKVLGPVKPTFKLPPDMRVFESGSFDDFNKNLLFSRLKQYAEKYSEPSPDHYDEDWVRNIASTRKLVRFDENQEMVQPTLAGWLLFAMNPTSCIAQATIKLIVSGSEYWLKSIFGDDVNLKLTNDQSEYKVEQIIGGTLWNQLKVLIDLMALLNIPFVLKEAKSRQVTPYHPQALKEMIVNALVHRDYGIKEPTCIRVSVSQIEVVSPGGLTDELSAKTGAAEIEKLVREGSRGELKAYRNPAISGLFYESSEMDRKGSGLPDMLRKTIDNNGDVHFGPMKGNRAFRVVVHSRPEAIDEITRTAVADQSKIVRFTSNLAEFVSIPDRVWCASIDPESARRSSDKFNYNQSVPPNIVQDGDLYTFYNLSQLASKDSTFSSKFDITELSLQDLFEKGNGLSIIRKLLYDAIGDHLQSIGLVVDRERRRAHFPRCEKPNRKISYKALVKRATRTIVKARTRRDSDDILYFEHKSFSFSIMPFGKIWGMFINPGYVFTFDGRQRYLDRDRINILSTKRAARDFNPNVRNDVNFWMAYLSDESEGVFALSCDKSKLYSDYAPTILLSSSIPGIAFNSTTFDAGLSKEDEFASTLSEVNKELEYLALKEDQAHHEPKNIDNGEAG